MKIKIKLIFFKCLKKSKGKYFSQNKMKRDYNFQINDSLRAMN